MKIIYLESTIENCSLHFVGNKVASEGLCLSDSLLKLEDNLKDILNNYFINSFSSEECFQLYHDSGIEYNVVYGAVSQIFNNPRRLYEQSINLAKHLYDQSTHPKIKGGEFYTVYFRNCVVDGDTVNAVGLFKSENKDTFLKVLREEEHFNLESERGINIKKLDKGCLIFNKERENGYVVVTVDNTNKGNEAQYWIDDFLHIRQRQDDYSNTRNVMNMTRDFVVKALPNQFNISRADQIDLLNRSLEFFKKQDKFEIKDFTNNVIKTSEIIKGFNSFKQHYEIENDIIIDDNFDISNNAFKKQKRSYKRVISLDNKIQIVINGNRNQVEQGKDDRGRYYKIYYNKEV